MKIESVQIKNLRSFAGATIQFNDYTCLVGPNGAGKSTVHCALNIFFRETDNATTDLSQLDPEDFHLRNTDEPVEITVTFTDLSAEAQQDFAGYYRHGKLIVSAIARYDRAQGKAIVRQYGQRLGMSAFAEFFRAEGDGRRVGELKEIYTRLRPQFELPEPGTKVAMVEALRKYEADRPDECDLQPSEDQFYGVSKGENRLAKYIQWVYVPAVKDASSEQLEARNSALGQLLARTVRAKTNFEEDVKALREQMQEQYRKLLSKNQHALADISSSLKSRLIEWAHPEATVKLEWRQDPDRSVRVEEPLARLIAGEGQFEGDITRFGHGLQRSYLLALLHVLATATDAAAPRLILGCEEPELYQHPPQARHLSTVLQTLSTRNAQVIVTTHSPTFVSGEGFENVRMVRKSHGTKASSVAHMAFADLASSVARATGEQLRRPEGALAKIHQALQPSLSEMFFTNRLVLVEGLEDAAFISAYLHLLGQWDEFRRLGCHIVSTNKKSEMLQPLIIAKHMGIPTLLVFDSDAGLPDKNGSRAKHERDNRALLTIANLSAENPLPKDSVWAKGLVMWAANIGSAVEQDIGTAEWASFSTMADEQYGQAGGLHKNVLHIAAAMSFAWDDGKRSESLRKVCEAVLDLENSIA
jgi:putative ATP-dependent endonuclease of OLD family